MKFVKNPFFILTSIMLLIIVVGFAGDFLFFLFASSEDKLYDDNNKYINGNSSLGVNDNYEVNQKGNEVLFGMSTFFINVMKIFSILIIPLILYFLFLHREGIINFLNRLFN